MAVSFITKLAGGVDPMNRENEAPEAEDDVVRERGVVERFPGSAEAHYNLGNSLLRSGDVKGAIESYGRAVELKPGFPQALSNLGVALLHERRLDEARECFLRAVELEPNDALAHNNLGHVAMAIGSNEEAQGHFRRAIGLAPEFADGVFNLGHALLLAGRLVEAIECFERTVRMQPGHVSALNNLGNIFREQDRLEEAIGCYQRAIGANPHVAEIHNNLGVALRDSKQPELAIESFGRALGLVADYAEAVNNLGNAYKDVGLLERAIACHRRAIALAPHEPMYYDNLGLCLLDQGDLGESAACFEQSLRMNPESPHIHWARSFILLIQGDLENGFAEYEWRWRCPEWRRFLQVYFAREHKQPVWDGSSLEGKTILLQAEQGLGDTIQFVRYLPLVRKRGGRIVLQCPRSLMALMATAGADEVVPPHGELPPFDVRAWLMTLPAIFKTTLESIPSEAPYLFAEPGLVKYWKEKLSGLLSAGSGDPRTTADPRTTEGTRVGINWRGRPGKGVFRMRDIPLECFERLSRLPGVRLVSLQGGAGREDLGAGSGDPRTTHGSEDARTAAPIVDLGSDVDTAHGAFMDTAAIIKNLDLVITSDTAVAHLAGALGVPVWVGLPFAADWRWLLGRSDSPWYPTMRLFRQKRRGDWQGVFEEIEAELREFAERRETTNQTNSTNAAGK